MTEKITPAHLARAAYVYVRQSTPHQVRDNRESQRRQYSLADRARELGFREVVVVDEDLGVSGTGSQDRPGFARLLTMVCEGRVGAVLALEASRLARNSRDWHHLIDLCALTETLVIDFEGAYDPKSLNDRMLLGLKGTMSEFELGLLRQRAQEALRQMIQRGEVLTELPVGYVRTEENGCELTPDMQVRAAIHGVFSKFSELGSARQVLLWYRQEKIPLPTIQPGTAGKEFLWRLPVYARILSLIKNPTYAGAFVYGRRRTRTKLIDGRARRTSGHELAQEDWEVVILDHHPGYISWDQFLQNQKQIRQNSAMRGRMAVGAARAGTALLAGILRCERCGRKLHVSYGGKKNKAFRYHCKGGQINHGTAWCISFSGRKVDEAVSLQVLEALEPAGVQAALEAWEQISGQEDEKVRQLRLAVEKARYEAERAQRQYDAVEPENRLVAAELEGRWDTALTHLRELTNRLEEAISKEDAPSSSERERLLDLGRDLRSLWNHPEVNIALKKRILRAVLKEIVADVDDEPPEVVLHLHWAGGVHTRLRVRKNRVGHHSRCTDQKIIDLVRELVQVCNDQDITRILNRLGYRTGTDKTWTQSRVKSLRNSNKIPAFDAAAPRSWVTLGQAAEALQVSETSVRRLLKENILPGRQVVPYAPWVIERSNLELSQVQAAVAALKAGRKLPSKPSGQTDLPLFSTT